MSDDRWVETPMFMLRRDCLSHATRGWQPGRFLELGSGTGRLTKGFLERGFTGVCYDLGATTRDLLRRNLSQFGPSIQIIDSLDDAARGAFDYVFAFEVLEHIEADAEAHQLLSRWKRDHHKDSPHTPEALSIRSGVERSDASVRLARLLNRRTLAPFIALQRVFFGTDLGDGYVAHASLAVQAEVTGPST